MFLIRFIYQLGVSCALLAAKKLDEAGLLAGEPAENHDVQPVAVCSKGADIKGELV